MLPLKLCFPFRAVFVLVVATPTRATRRLFAISPDVPKFLAVVTLFKGILVFELFYVDGNVSEAGESEDVLGFCHKIQS
jgi:hypothetical protein